MGRPVDKRPPSIRFDGTRPGDIVFCHSSGILGKAIRFGEWLRFRKGDFYNHVAVVDRPAANGDWYVIQAEASGVTNDKLLSSVAPGGSYIIVPSPASIVSLDFARAQVGEEYGWLTIASLVLTILLPKFIRLPSFRSSGSWICSALVGETLRAGGWIHSWEDIYQVLPSELYAAMTGLTVRQVSRGLT